jgi:hypothetical protein
VKCQVNRPITQPLQHLLAKLAGRLLVTHSGENTRNSAFKLASATSGCGPRSQVQTRRCKPTRSKQEPVTASHGSDNVSCDCSRNAVIPVTNRPPPTKVRVGTSTHVHRTDLSSPLNPLSADSTRSCWGTTTARTVLLRTIRNCHPSSCSRGAVAGS